MAEEQRDAVRQAVSSVRQAVSSTGHSADAGTARRRAS